VNALGGEIGVDSVVGKGSIFWVELPVVKTDAHEETRDEWSTQLPERSLNILLVEDNEINRIVAGEMLIADGHSVVEAHDGRQGVDLSTATKFDLILMDISMPVLDGRAATRVIRSENGASTNTPIIALTANAMAEEQAGFIKDGMNGILTKPLSRESLRGLLLQTQASTEDDGATLVNHGHCVETRDALGEETFVKLRSRFVVEVDELHAWLVSNEAQDFLEIASRSHKVAGSAAVFGADRLREALRSIETSAKMGDGQVFQEQVSALTLIWQSTKFELSS
jgi:CheY-like chemotaxis protein